jgi:hypothetical protein
MTAKCWLESIASIASIVTAIAAAWAYGRYLTVLRRKRVRLEQYLKSEKTKNTDRGQRTVLHLSAVLALTEADILQAAFDSRNIVRRIEKDDNGKADRLLLEYETRK